ncbi:MAG TPA: hypothetical protein VH682_13725 [Gemmataceae bacterium]|jgi:Leucine-rich repeat (LRR) protein/predicted Zn-dependent protease
MKARIAFVLVALLFLAARTPAGHVDKVKLRELAELPTVSVTVGINFSITFGFSFNGKKPDPLAEIAQLQKQMKGDPSDVERYLRLSRLYTKAKREKKSDESDAKAVAICREQVRKHPDDMSWLARLGEALVSSDEIDEGEKLLRRAVKDAPKEWRAWLGLAECVDRLALRVISGDKPFSIRYFDEKVMISALGEKQPTAKQIADTRRLWKEARRYYDRAVELAPRQTKPYFLRIGSNWIHGAMEMGLRKNKGGKVNLLSALFTPEIAADMGRIARLTPNDPKNIGSAVLVEIMTGILHDKTEVKKGYPSFEDFLAAKSRSLVESLPAASRKSVSWGMERLEQLTKGPDKGTAAAASEILADLLMVIKRMDEDRDGPPLPTMGGMAGGYLDAPSSSSLKEDKTAKVRQHLHRAVQLDPSRDRAWDMLTMLLAEEEKNDEAINVARKRIVVKDNAHNRFLLAKVYADGDRFYNAAEELRAGLEDDSKDLKCRLGLIAALLKRDNAESLKEASEQIAAVAPQMKEEKSEQRQRNYLLLRGIHAALSDRPGRAKECLQEVLHQSSIGDTTAAKALAALGEPLGPMDESLAVDYLRAWKGKVERADERPGSPVARVRLGDDKITDKDLIFLAAFPQLQELDLSFTSITDAGLAQLKELTVLRELGLRHTKITDKGLVHLKPLMKLRILSLDSREITDAGLAHLEALSKLEKLEICDIYDTETITEAGLAHLRKLPWLRSLQLSMQVTDKGMAQIAAIPRLRSLYLFSNKITDEGMRHFERLTELRELWLGGDKITDTGLAHLKALHRLHRLNLSNSKITDAGLVHLKNLTQLSILILSDTAVTDAGLAHLREMTNLQELDLSNRRGSMGLLLASFPGAEDKKPAKPKITDAGLKHLRGLSELRQLDLEGHPITAQGIAELRKALPKLEVRH